MTPWTIEQFAQILSARERVVAREGGGQAFLHTLEMQTHRDFLTLNPQLSVAARCERRALVLRVCECLCRRVDRRLAGQSADETPSLDDTRAITRMFEAASRTLANRNDVGGVLLDFAAGALARVAYFRHGDRRHRYRVSEPDSGFIFLFAEFGFAGHAFGMPFWTRRLLFDLVKMQRYFLERNAHQRPRPWRQYRQPDRPLSNEARVRIDRDYARSFGPSPTICRLEQMMLAHLEWAERVTAQRRAVAAENAACRNER